MRTRIWGYISVGIAGMLGLLIVNFFLQPLPLSLTSPLRLAVFFPIILSPIGLAAGYAGYRKGKDAYSRWGMFSNGLLLLFTQVYWVFGALLFGP
ncbi:hypothetical protein GTO91_04260 [Heliobacterium undosum]|uniref:Potassium transporter KefB n=1 Tax=Heliomicrobium undosum TaxID=121734 RepID=A0A845KYG5_9FIRM|nr:hypothetical protein [Heliomicrobium undosum]MZP28922.1 hypothetical protein [Heliomicrobium undosum]